jgi:hypothetical protein
VKVLLIIVGAVIGVLVAAVGALAWLTRPRPIGPDAHDLTHELSEEVE